MSTRSKKRKTRRHGAMSSAKHKLYLRLDSRIAARVRAIRAKKRDLNPWEDPVVIQLQKREKSIRKKKDPRVGR